MTLTLIYVVKIMILSDLQHVLGGGYCSLKSYEQKSLRNSVTFPHDIHTKLPTYLSPAWGQRTTSTRSDSHPISLLLGSAQLRCEATSSYLHLPQFNLNFKLSKNKFTVNFFFIFIILKHNQTNFLIYNLPLT